MLSFEKKEQVEINKPYKIVGDFLGESDHDLLIMRDCINKNADILNQLYDYIEKLEEKINQLEQPAPATGFDIILQMIKEGKSSDEIGSMIECLGVGIEYKEHGIKFPWNK